MIWNLNQWSESDSISLVLELEKRRRGGEKRREEEKRGEEEDERMFSPAAGAPRSWGPD